MMILSLFLSILLHGLATNAQQHAHFLRSADVSARDLAPGGGWALNVQGCNYTATQAGCLGCCPSSWDCSFASGQTASSACCPSGSACQAAIAAIPFCANSSWSLWNVTTSTLGAGYFCCLPGQIGLETGDCVDSDTVIAATLSAQPLVSGVPTGQAPAPNVASTATTTHGGVVASLLSSLGSVISSEIPSPTHSSGAMAEAGVKGLVMGMAGAAVVAGIVLF